MISRKNLVLVHSFGTNSILLSPLIKYLSKYFNIYPIDLPGFKKDLPPFKKINIKSFSDFLDQKITELSLDGYLIAGISFGFLVVNNAKLNNKCEAILAAEPYLDSEYLKLNKFGRFKYLSVVKFINNFKLYNLLWKTTAWRKFNEDTIHLSQSEAKIFIDEVDAKTYFKTALFILDDDKTPKFHNLPYILVINPRDEILNSQKTIDFFKLNAGKLLIIETQLGHYPTHMNEEFLAKKLGKDKIEKLYDFLLNFNTHARTS